MRTAKEILIDKATKNNGSFLSGQIKWIEEAMKEYALEYNASKAPKRAKDIDIENVFKNVLAEVKKGHTIEAACKIVNIKRSMFYRRMSSIQKKELRSYKIASPIDGYWNDDLED